MVRQIVDVYSVWTPLQSVFYGLRLVSATRAFGVDCRVELVGVSLKEGVCPARRRARLFSMRGAALDRLKKRLAVSADGRGCM